MASNMRVWFLFKFTMFRTYNDYRSFTIKVFHFTIIIFVPVHFFCFLYESSNGISLILSRFIRFTFWASMPFSMIPSSLPKFPMLRTNYAYFLISLCIHRFAVIVFISMYCLSSLNKNFSIYSHIL